MNHIKNKKTIREWENTMSNSKPFFVPAIYIIKCTQGRIFKYHYRRYYHKSFNTKYSCWLSWHKPYICINSFGSSVNSRHQPISKFLLIVYVCVHKMSHYSPISSFYANVSEYYVSFQASCCLISNRHIYPYLMRITLKNSKKLLLNHHT